MFLSKLPILMARKGVELVTLRIIGICGEWLLVITETTIRGHNDGPAGSNMLQYADITPPCLHRSMKTNEYITMQIQI